MGAKMCWMLVLGQASIVSILGLFGAAWDFCKLERMSAGSQSEAHTENKTDELRSSSRSATLPHEWVFHVPTCMSGSQTRVKPVGGRSHNFSGPSWDVSERHPRPSAACDVTKKGDARASDHAVDPLLVLSFSRAALLLGPRWPRGGSLTLHEMVRSFYILDQDVNQVTIRELVQRERHGQLRAQDRGPRTSYLAGCLSLRSDVFVVSHPPIKLCNMSGPEYVLLYTVSHLENCS